MSELDKAIETIIGLQIIHKYKSYHDVDGVFHEESFCVNAKERKALEIVLNEVEKLNKLKDKLNKDISWFEKEKGMIFYDIKKLEKNNNTKHEYKFLYQEFEFINTKEIYAKKILEVLE